MLNRTALSPLLRQRLATQPAHSAKVITMATRKSSGLPEGYKEDLSKGKMLRFDDSLPRLPVPTLEETAKRYLKSVRAVVSPKEFEHTSKVVKDFLAPGSLGHELQKRLIARRDDPKIKNWIYDWWNEAAYMGYRDPVVPYVSYFYSHRDDRKRRNPATRAAAITTAALEFRKQVIEKTLEPEYMKKLPVAMNSYVFMFNCSRIPKKPADYLKNYEPNDHEYIVVVRKNQFFKVMHKVAGKQLTTKELEKQFETIYRVAEKADPVGIFTSENRDTWTEIRESLIAADPANQTSLETIEASSFVVCLDDAAPITLDERSHQYWHGDGMNRWFDKPLQFIINDNGTAGFMGEHSMMDGTATHRLNDTVCDWIFNDKLDFSNPDIRSNLPDPVPIRFNLNKELHEDISRAQTHFSKVIGAHELKVQAYYGYGKGLIKQFRCSPDAYVQMIIQLAYHKFYGKNRPTYESGMTRRFQQGRTETIRVVSEESAAFTAAMQSSDSSPEECRDLFKKALDAHVKYTADASDGRGVDRHMFGLKKCLKEGERLPEVFTDPAFAYSSTWFISTSQLSSEWFNGYGWSQVTDEGWGVAYMINENSLQFNIVSKRLGVDRFAHYVNEAASDLRELMTPTLAAPKAKL